MLALNEFDIGILDEEFVVVSEMPMGDNYTSTLAFLDPFNSAGKMIYSYRCELTNTVAEPESVDRSVVVDTAYSTSI